MRHLRFLTLVLASALCLPGAAALSQQDLPRRACSDADIRAALAGEYAGEPCRFTHMPDDVTVPARSAPVTLLGAPVSSSVSPANSVPDAHSGPFRVREEHIEAAVTDTVVLPDAFFTSGLTGGVERPYRPVYAYRGLILIAADGEVRQGFAGLERRVGTVRSMERATTSTVRRSYPYD